MISGGSLRMKIDVDSKLISFGSLCERDLLEGILTQL